MKKVIRRVVAALLFLSAGGVPHALGQADTVGTFLNLRGGAGYGVFRDLGASPLTYQGVELQPALALSWRRPAWRLSAAAGIAGGMYGRQVKISSLNILGGQPYVRVESLWCCLSSGRWHGWAGASLDDLFDIRYNSALGNSCVGIGNQVRLSLSGRAEYSLKRWAFHGQLDVVPAALVLRPGFAYIANYDRDMSNPVANTFEQYRWYVAVGCGLSTEVGATLRLRNGNRIGLTYHWHHVTSRTSAAAPWRFDAASHWLCWDFAFLLKGAGKSVKSPNENLINR